MEVYVRLRLGIATWRCRLPLPTRSLSLIIRYKYVQQPPIYTKDYANSSYDRNLVVAHVFLGLCCGLICACYVVLSGSLRKAWKRKKYNRRKRLRCVDITWKKIPGQELHFPFSLPFWQEAHFRHVVKILLTAVILPLCWPHSWWSYLVSIKILRMLSLCLSQVT